MPIVRSYSLDIIPAQKSKNRGSKKAGKEVMESDLVLTDGLQIGLGAAPTRVNDRPKSVSSSPKKNGYLISKGGKVGFAVGGSKSSSRRTPKRPSVMGPVSTYHEP